VLALHIPLGASIVAGSMMLAHRVWRDSATSDSEADEPAYRTDDTIAGGPAR
jgi:hypothetical protein